MYSIVEGGKMPLFISNNRLHKGSGFKVTPRDFSKPFVKVSCWPAYKAIVEFSLNLDKRIPGKLDEEEK
jgi:hypothetical protein